jgi:hypothetical protein
MSEQKKAGRDLVRGCRRRLDEIRDQKHKHFDELNSLTERIVYQFSEFLPRYTKTSSGSKVVHHPNAPDTQPISLEKEHGSREYLPNRFANFAIEGIERLLDYLDGLFQ